MPKLTDPVEIEISPEELVKPKLVEQKKIIPVKYYRVNLNKSPKTDLKGLIPNKPKDIV